MVKLTCNGKKISDEELKKNILTWAKVDHAVEESDWERLELPEYKKSREMLKNFVEKIDDLGCDCGLDGAEAIENGIKMKDGIVGQYISKEIAKCILRNLD